MRVLKLQAREKKCLAKIEELHLGEYGWLLKDCIACAVLMYSFWLAPVVISVSTFVTCILLGISLTAGCILSAIATFGVLQEALSSFPGLISVYAQTKVGTENSHKILIAWVGRLSFLSLLCINLFLESFFDLTLSLSLSLPDFS
jgi:hypothetical protein